MKSLLRVISKMFTIGCSGSFGASENRIVIFTNATAYWGMVTLAIMLLNLIELGVPDKYVLYQWAFIALTALAIPILNFNQKCYLAKVLSCVLLNLVAWHFAILFGVAFNVYQFIFAALTFAIISFSKESLISKIMFIGAPLFGLLAMELLEFKNITPILNYSLEDFNLWNLIFSSLSMMGFLTILIGVEKSVSDRYERELSDLKENLETIVENKTKLLVEEKDEAVQSSLMKTQFVANISHELRTPVQGMIGFVEMALRRLAKMTPLDEKNEALKEKVTKSLNSADISSARLLDLIDTLLNVARTENAGFVARPEMLSINSVLEQAIHEVRCNETSDNTLDIKCEINLSYDEVVSDKTLVIQVVNNLMTNAVRYSSEPKKVRIVVSESADEKVKMSFVNQGFGIDPTDVESIFEPFVQGVRTNYKGVGTGLGLSLCRKYAQALDGDVVLTDPSAENTTFDFIFSKQLNAASKKLSIDSPPALEP